MSAEDDFYRPYQKLQAVQDLEDQNFLLECFSSHWKLKYRSDYIYPVTRAHIGLIKGFKQQAGTLASELIEHFFQMKDEWFLKQRYSLDCLCKNINAVNASYTLKRVHRNLSGEIRIQVFCDSCEKELELCVPFKYDFDTATRCVECTQGNKPTKRTTKAQRQKAIHGFGIAFPELPKDETVKLKE